MLKLKQWQSQLLESLDEWDRLEFYQEVEFLPFEETRKFVRSLKLKNQREWVNYCKLGNRPNNIPFSPQKMYKDKGWVSWGDWLGTGSISTYDKVFRPFKEARKFVRSLKLKGQKEWMQYYKSGNKPDDIPAAPHKIYKDKGWISCGNWLGTGSVATQNKIHLPFEEAKKFVHSLNLKNFQEWKNYCKSGDRPNDIPAAPYKIYEDKGWISIGDWLGTGSVATQNKIHLPFDKAKKFIHSLKLKTQKEWREYSKSGKKPDNIPSNPDKIYKDKGWVGYGDWLGRKNA